MIGAEVIDVFAVVGVVDCRVCVIVTVCVMGPDLYVCALLCLSSDQRSQVSDLAELNAAERCSETSFSRSDTFTS